MAGPDFETQVRCPLCPERFTVAGHISGRGSDVTVIADVQEIRAHLRSAHARKCAGPNCEAVFYPTRSSRRYHSDACRVAAARARR